MISIRGVVFDIGETLVDRTREYRAWAEFFDIPPHTFSAVFGARVIAGWPVAKIIESFGNGRSFAELARQRTDRGLDVEIEEQDLYPDVRTALSLLRSNGLRLGIAGNQPVAVSEELRRLNLGVGFIAASSDWGVSKPSASFFQRAAGELDLPAGSTLYVGDQLRNDVVAPQKAGLSAVRILRGPWGHLERDPSIEQACLGIVTSLLDISPLVAS